jgi:Uma2 family endonuclease
VNDVAATRASVGIERHATMRTGPLGSTIHVIRADPETVVALAAIDWNRAFPRVYLDPVQGLITLMAPSRLHDELARALDHIVDIAASALTGAVKGLLSARLRKPDSPPGTGLEPDCAFYVGDRARAYRGALAVGKDAADAFFNETAPDLVVEVEITNADEGKIERYADLGVREIWLLQDQAGSDVPSAEFLALRPRTASRRLTSPNVLRGLTPDDVRQAVADVRLSVTRDERTEAVARIVRRRRRTSVRVREGDSPYAARSG